MACNLTEKAVAKMEKKRNCSTGFENELTVFIRFDSAERAFVQLIENLLIAYPNNAWNDKDVVVSKLLLFQPFFAQMVILRIRFEGENIEQMTIGRKINELFNGLSIETANVNVETMDRLIVHVESILSTRQIRFRGKGR